MFIVLPIEWPIVLPIVLPTGPGVECLLAPVWTGLFWWPIGPGVDYWTKGPGPDRLGLLHFQKVQYLIVSNLKSQSRI